MKPTEPSKPSAHEPQVLVWDLPTRLFHWLLALGVLGSFVTVKLGLMDWHGRIGGFVLSLLLFRLIWGVWGGATARFSQFLPTPARLVAYLRGRAWSGLGHNPLGALSVVALLGVFLIQALAGLATTDEIAYDGPLVAVVSSDWVEWAGWVHLTTEPLLMGLVLLHVIAILFYRIRKGQNLVRPMITGYGPTPHSGQVTGVVDRSVDRLRAAGSWAFSAALIVGVFVGF